MPFEQLMHAVLSPHLFCSQHSWQQSAFALAPPPASMRIKHHWDSMSSTATAATPTPLLPALDVTLAVIWLANNRNDCLNIAFTEQHLARTAADTTDLVRSELLNEKAPPPLAGPGLQLCRDQLRVQCHKALRCGVVHGAGRRRGVVARGRSAGEVEVRHLLPEHSHVSADGTREGRVWPGLVDRLGELADL